MQHHFVLVVSDSTSTTEGYRRVVLRSARPRDVAKCVRLDFVSRPLGPSFGGEEFRL